MNGKIGIFLTTDIALPYKKDNPLDVEAAERMNIFNINWLLEPLVTGDWPEMMKQAAGSSGRLPELKPQESDSLKNSIDFIGAVHKTYYLTTYQERQKDVTGQSFYKDVIQ